MPADQQKRFDFAPESEKKGLELFCAGDLNLVREPCVAVVGTRDVSPEGARRAAKLGRELAAAGVVVVSGLARGVDTYALKSAIEAGGRVVAVIGTPLEKAYPAENAALQESIYRDHLLVTPFAPGRVVTKGNFPERNKVMAALTDATAIIEASDTSGTLHQAAECRRLGRWLFIANSIIENPSVTWPSKWTKYEMTRCFTKTEDILAVLPKNE
jgi:DNA processing protein